MGAVYNFPATVARVLFEAGLIRANGHRRMLYHPLGRFVLSSIVYFFIVLTIVTIARQ